MTDCQDVVLSQPLPRRWAGGRLRATCALLAAALLAAATLIVGCEFGPPGRAPGAAPPPTFTGPAFLRGTVGSMCYMRDARPLLVSKYGLVVNLDGTGSGQVPPELRQRLINEMLKRKVGSESLDDQTMRSITPEAMLARNDTAVVAVQGFIPPGAQPGTRFDLLVSPWPRTDTTSLAGGTLWTTDLNELGTDLTVTYMETLAVARGPIYINPFQNLTPKQRAQEFQQQAIVIGGGRVTEPRRLELLMNQASYPRVRAISDRINGRFGLVTDPKPIADPQTDSLIELNIPERYASHPGDLLELINYLYVQGGVGFEQSQGMRLGEVLQAQPQFEHEVKMSWMALGRTALPAIRRFYDDEQLPVRLAALEAGANLGDETASTPLYELSQHEDAQVRLRVARALVFLPRSLRGARTLKALLDDDELGVRIAAYDSLASNNDPIVDRVIVLDPEQGMKFVIDRVPSDRPMVYITHETMPRLVIFSEQLGFKTPMLARMWDNHLMIRADDADQPMNVYYQASHDVEGKEYDNVYPSVATLAYLLGHRPTMDRPQEGLNLSYSEVVDAVNQLCRAGHIDAPIHFRVSPLQRLIDEYDRIQPAEVRPETTASTDQPEDQADEDAEPVGEPLGSGSEADSRVIDDRAAAAETTRPETADVRP